MLNEFKAFVMRGNVIDLAVGLVMGSSFGAIVNSLVNDVIMPPIGRVLGRVDFTNLFLTLSGQHYPSLAAAKMAGAPTLNYGVFLNTIVNFLIVAFAMFMVIRQVNRLYPKPAPVAPATKECEFCASPIPRQAKRCPHCTSELRAA